MTDCNQLKIDFPACKRRRIEVDFSGGDISSNGGVGLLDLAERRVGLLSDLARRLDDGRQAGKVRHGLLPLLRQRVYSVALGYEDANDHDALRDDLALQTACGGDRRLASASTIGRLDRAADRAWAWAAHEAMVETFIASFDAPPEELILDFDATDDAVHGRQEGRFFHGYYDHHCFLPLYVFCGDQLLVSYLNRPRFTGERLVQILGCFFMCVQGFIEHLLCFVRRDISDGAVKTLGVVPIDPFQRFPFKLAH